MKIEDIIYKEGLVTRGKPIEPKNCSDLMVKFRGNKFYTTLLGIILITFGAQKIANYIVARELLLDKQKSKIEKEFKPSNNERGFTKFLVTYINSRPQKWGRDIAYFLHTK